LKFAKAAPRKWDMQELFIVNGSNLSVFVVIITYLPNTVNNGQAYSINALLT